MAAVKDHFILSIRLEFCPIDKDFQHPPILFFSIHSKTELSNPPPTHQLHSRHRRQQPLHLKEQEHTNSGACYPENRSQTHSLPQIFLEQNTKCIIGCSDYCRRSHNGVKLLLTGTKRIQRQYVPIIIDEWSKHSEKDGAQTQNDSHREYPSML